MGLVVKIGIGAALVGLVIYSINYAKRAADLFSFSLVGYGMPNLTNYILSIPLTLRFVNPTSFPLNIDRLTADIFIMKSNAWVPAGRIDQAVSIPAGTSDQGFIAQINLSGLFGGSLVNTLQSIAEMVKNRVVQIRTDVTAAYGPITIPTQSYSQALPINI